VDLQTEYHNLHKYFYIGGALIADDIICAIFLCFVKKIKINHNLNGVRALMPVSYMSIDQSHEY